MDAAAPGQADLDRLAEALTAPGRPLPSREAAAIALAEAGDPRAFETLVLLLNYRDRERARAAARALGRLGDPRTGRAAAALATNPLRVAHAVPSIDLLVELRAPEAVPALSETLGRLLAQGDVGHEAATACVTGLGRLGDERALPVLRAAAAQPRLFESAAVAIARISS